MNIWAALTGLSGLLKKIKSKKGHTVGKGHVRMDIDGVKGGKQGLYMIVFIVYE